MIDSHAHVAFYQFDEDRDEVIARAREAGVSWIEIGTDLEQSRKVVELEALLSQGFEERSPLLGVTVGIHPSDISKGVDWKEFEDLMQEEAVAAIGEVGIDLYHQQNLDEQLEVLRKFIHIAEARDLPVVFHVRDATPPPAPPLSGRGGTLNSPPDRGELEGGWNAHDEMIKFLQERNFGNGVIHTFSGNAKQAKEYLELGLYLSFSGVVTFKNAGEILEVVKKMPRGKMLIETDCPFLAPEPYRGKRNEPAYVKHVAEKIAEVRGISVEEVEQMTERNTRELFGL